CTVLLGSHTFLGLARESFPVNHYLEIVLGCLIVANLALSERPNWWRDAAAATAVLLSLATLESGALVWVCLAAGMLSGAAGVSKRGFALATAVVLGYIAIRVFVVGMPLPGLAERSTGFGFARLEPADLTTRFGDRPLVLYTYNIVSSILTVLWSEPRAGEWMFLRAFLSGDVRPWMWINVVSSLLLCGATVAWWFHPRARVGIRNSHEAYVRVAFPAVLVANAVISYSYTKDVLMAPAGVFAAAAAYYATRALFDRSRAALVPIVPLGIAVLLAVLSIGWAARAAGFYYNMREAAFLRANEWALVDQWLSKERIVLQDGASLALVDELRSRALADEVPNPYFAQRWASRYVDRGQR
ncbi:MAG: hypothetical protein NTY02_19005, partial [Acidobacteria bacterium]|nr:hypothetical protein [Acidobacteriota bacterium]